MKKELAIIYLTGVAVGVTGKILVDDILLKLKDKKREKFLKSLSLELVGLSVYLSRDERNKDATKEDIDNWICINKKSIKEWLIENKENISDKWTLEERSEKLREFANSL